MNGIVVAAALQSSVLGLPQLVFDGGGVCEDPGRAQSVLGEHQGQIPVDATVTMSVQPNGEDGAAAVEVSVSTSGETSVVERQVVNSCDEAFSYLDFYLSLWAPESPIETEEGVPAGPSKIGAKVTAGAFGHATTNHPSGVGLGVGAGVDVSFETIRLGAFGLWNQSSTLAADPETATFELERQDFGAHACALPTAGWAAIWPCLGASGRRYWMASSEAAPSADLSAVLPSVDASVLASLKLSSNTSIEGVLALRYALLPLQLGELQVGEFAPAQFEINLRVGLTWDIPGLIGDHSSAPIAAKNDRGRTQSW